MLYYHKTLIELRSKHKQYNIIEIIYHHIQISTFSVYDYYLFQESNNDDSVMTIYVL